MLTRFNRVETFTNHVGTILVGAFHVLALFVIGAAIVWAAFFEFLRMVDKGSASVEDILLLFIYLELGAMVGIYFLTKRMPVRFLIYIAITALTRMLIAAINVDHTPSLAVIYIPGAILLLTISVFIIKYGSYRYPSGILTEPEMDDADANEDAMSPPKK